MTLTLPRSASSIEFMEEQAAFKALYSRYQQILSTDSQQGHLTHALAYDVAKLDFQFSSMQEFIQSLELKIDELDQFLLDQESFLRSTPTLFPTNGWITSYFGARVGPYTGLRKMHEGIDIGAPAGTNIVAPADGMIIYAGQKTGLGNFVQIDHGYGIETLFGHAKKLYVEKGQFVKRGDPVAQVGNTGWSTGPHVHYEVRINGIAVDPLYFILDR